MLSEGSRDNKEAPSTDPDKEEEEEEKDGDGEQEQPEKRRRVKGKTETEVSIAREVGHCQHLMGVPTTRCTILGVPKKGFIVYWGLHWVPLILGKYHMFRVWGSGFEGLLHMRASSDFRTSGILARPR